MTSGKNKMDNNLEDQFISMQALNDELSSHLTKIMSDMKKRDSESTKMSSDKEKIKKILTQTMSQKHNYL